MYRENMDIFYKRLDALMKKYNISDRQLSLDIGQSESYINKIRNYKIQPYLECFFLICDYFQIEPSEFFNDKVEDPLYMRELMNQIKLMTEQQKRILLLTAKEFIK